MTAKHCRDACGLCSPVAWTGILTPLLPGLVTVDSSFNLSVSQFPTCKVEMPINSGSQGGLLCRFHRLAHMEPLDWWIAPGSGLLLLSLFLSWGGGAWRWQHLR